MAKKRNKTKRGSAATKAVFKGIVVLIVIALVAYVITSLVLGGIWNPLKWSKSSTVKPMPDMGNTSNGNISLASYALSAEDYEAYGISEQAESAYILTATVKDENGSSDGVPQAVELSMDWENSSSEWATDKSVPDFMNVQKISENSYSVSCLQAFGEPVLIKLKAIGSDAYAVKRCEYVKRLNSVDFATDFESSYDFEFTSTVTVNYGIGTIQGEFNCTSFEVKFSAMFMAFFVNGNSYLDYFTQQCADVGVNYTFKQTYTFTLNDENSDSVLSFSLEDILHAGISAEDFNTVKQATNDFEYFKYAIKYVVDTTQAATNRDFSCTLSYTYEYEDIVNESSTTNNMYCKLTGLGSLSTASEVAFDNTEDYVF